MDDEHDLTDESSITSIGNVGIMRASTSKQGQLAEANLKRSNALEIMRNSPIAYSCGSKVIKSFESTAMMWRNGRLAL